MKKYKTNEGAKKARVYSLSVNQDQVKVIKNHYGDVIYMTYKGIKEELFQKAVDTYERNAGRLSFASCLDFHYYLSRPFYTINGVQKIGREYYKKINK